LCFFDGKNKHIIPLHSKLKTGMWPSIGQVLNKILLFLPKFSSEIILYDKEKGLEEKSDNNNSEENKNNEIMELIGTKLQFIKVNVYRYHNPIMIEMIENVKKGKKNIINIYIIIFF
jgi:hypothetical protein